jgi:hypothetical protein
MSSARTLEVARTRIERRVDHGFRQDSGDREAALGLPEASVVGTALPRGLSCGAALASDGPSGAGDRDR